MHIDLNVAEPPGLSADVAIVGSGAAGQTIAKVLAAAGQTVILLESGGLDYEAATADLNAGRNVGQPYYALDHARLRLFGGTTAIWGGRCAELSEIDFESRPWVPWSGWPFALDTLRPYYDQAWKLLGIDPASPVALPRGLRPFAASELVEPLLWRIDTVAERFGLPRNKDLLRDERIQLITHATVREIVPSANGKAISYLDVRNLGGKTLTAKAKFYVIAAGGIENPRLLLASNSVQPSGLGNSRDLVGRFFMEHPHGRGGRIVDAPAWQLVRAFQKRAARGHDIAFLLAGTRTLQERHGILNSALSLAMRPPPAGNRSVLTRAYHSAKYRLAPDKRGRLLWQTYKQIRRATRDTLTPFNRWLRYKRGKSELALVLRAEQSPNPDSRVRLANTTDELGSPRVELDWRLQRQDRETVAALVGALATEMRGLGLGSVEPAHWLSTDEGNWETDHMVSSHPFGGYHHMGTTRMADNPAHGVTDGWGKVHGFENLFVAGSSLFPTSGWANPTLTILALSLRTADRIAGLAR